MTIPKPDAWERRCSELSKLFADLAPKGAELIRLGSMPSNGVDGWPSSSLGPEVRGGSGLTGPERAAASTGNHEATDLVKQWVSEIFRLTSRCLSDARRIGRVVELIDKRADLRARDAGAGFCLACGCYVSGAANDRLRAGYCAACHKAYQRATSAGYVNPANFRWERFAAREQAEGRPPSWSAFRALQAQDA